MKIMKSKIDQMIQEEYEDYMFLEESPSKATSIKIAKTRVKEIIQEELDRASAEQAPVWSKETGFANKKPDRSRDRFNSDLDWRWNIFTHDYLYAASGFNDVLLREAQRLGERFREGGADTSSLAVTEVAKLKNKYFNTPEIVALDEQGSEQVQYFDAEFDWIQQELMDMSSRY